MTFLDTQLNLVNRTLRHGGHHEALEREEQGIVALASQGHDIRWIGAQVLASRASEVITYHGDITLGR